MSLPKNVFLIDDDVDDQLFFVEALKEIDSEIRCELAVNGKEALEKLKSFAAVPDIIFLDLNMPFMNGYEFLQHLRNEVHYNAIPIVIFTTSNNPKDAEITTQLGVKVFFTKPNEYDKLREKLARILSMNFKDNVDQAIQYSE